jgi:hypothetical protein
MDKKKSGMFDWIELEGMPHYLMYSLTFRITIHDLAEGTQEATCTLQVLSSHGWRDLHCIRAIKQEAITRLQNYADKLFRLNYN